MEKCVLGLCLLISMLSLKQNRDVEWHVFLMEWSHWSVTCAPCTLSSPSIVVECEQCTVSGLQVLSPEDHGENLESEFSARTR